MMNTTHAKDFYETLGVAKTASPEEIRKAYLRLAQKNHPDKTGGDKKAEDRLKEINGAYDTLKRPERRKEYDDARENPFADAQFHTQRPGASPGFENSMNFADFDLGSLFGGGFDEFLKGRAGGFQNAAGPSFETRVRVSLREAADGVTRTVSLAAPDGKTRQVTVTIPPGAESGLRLRLAGQGGPAPSGAVAGDLFVVVEVEPDPVFEREGQNLVCEAGVSFVDAALGASITVPTLRGKAKLSVPAGTQPGQQFRLKGLGMPPVGGGPKGDQIVRVQVEVPRRLTPEQRDLIERLGKLDKKRN